MQSGKQPTVVQAYACRELGHNFRDGVASGIVAIPRSSYESFANGDICADNLFNVFVTPNGQLPLGLGFKVGPGTGLNYIVTCAHYHDHQHGIQPNGDVNGLKTTTSVTIMYQTIRGDAAVDIKPAAQLVISRYKSGVIPAHSYDTEIPVSFRMTEPVSITAVGVLLHTHTIARKAELHVHRFPDGDDEVILAANITSPSQYENQSDIQINQNDTIQLICAYDNPSDVDIKFG